LEAGLACQRIFYPDAAGLRHPNARGRRGGSVNIKAKECCYKKIILTNDTFPTDPPQQSPTTLPHLANHQIPAIEWNGGDEFWR